MTEKKIAIVKNEAIGKIAYDMKLNTWLIISSGAEEKKLRTLLEYCKKGPEGSKVKRIEASWQGCKNEFSEFNTL